MVSYSNSSFLRKNDLDTMAVPRSSPVPFLNVQALIVFMHVAIYVCMHVTCPVGILGMHNGVLAYLGLHV